MTKFADPNEQLSYIIVDSDNETSTVARRVVVHEFTISDVEDPQLYAAEPLWKWQQSEAGQWVIQNSMKEPEWSSCLDYNTHGHRFIIVAWFSEQDHVFFKLKFQ